MGDDRDDGHTHEARCLNCKALLAGDYCHDCGQKAHVHRTIGALWHDFLHSVLHVDGKFLRTVPLLALRPGQLTRRYVDGERAKYISPFALFLFSVLLTFAVFSAFGSQVIGGVSSVDVQFDEELDEARGNLATLERQRAGAIRDGKPTADLDRQIATAREGIQVLERFDGGIPLDDSKGSDSGSADADLADAPPALRFLDGAYRKAKANPSLLFYKLQANAYKFSWALIPLSVPLVWLLFLHRKRHRRQFTGYDHFVFVTHSISFMSLLLVLFVVLRGIGIDHGLVTTIFILIPPVHIYAQLRGAYSLSRFSAGWRTLLLLLFATLALTVFSFLLLALGIFG